MGTRGRGAWVVDSLGGITIFLEFYYRLVFHVGKGGCIGIGFYFPGIFVLFSRSLLDFMFQG